MSFWRQLTHGLRVLTHRTAADQDFEDELRDYLERSTADGIAKGLSAEEARRAASIETGSASAARDQVRSAGWEDAFATFFADFRFAVRQLRSHPGFTTVAVLTLALGIGAMTAIFSVVNPVLFETLPYPDARQLVMVWEKLGGGARMPSFGTFAAVGLHSRSFEALAAMKPWQPAITGTGRPERVEGQRVSAEYFKVLSVVPERGRDFQASDDVFRGPNVAILSHRLWLRLFHSDPAIIGRVIRLDDDAFTIIGVMPADFQNVAAPQAQVWAPLQYDPALLPDSRDWGHHLRVVGRLRSGLSRGQAAGEMETILHTAAQTYAKGYENSGGVPKGFQVDSLQADVTADVRPALLAVLGAVLLVLLIAWVNVTNLLLARGAQRRGEFAVRAALGASNSRLARQLVTESLVLSTIGGAVGMLFAEYSFRGLLALSPPELSQITRIRIDAPVFLFALIVTALIGVAIGIIPALHACRNDLQAGIQRNFVRAPGGHQRTRQTLVVAEVALALTLLVSAGLLLRSIQRLFSIDPGFRAAHVLTMQVEEAGHKYDSPPQSVQFYSDALQAVRAVPGVESAGCTSQLPLSGDSDSYGVQFEKDHSTENSSALRYAITPGYLEAMHIPLRSGRFFTDRDTTGSPRVAIVNESFARREFAGRDPLGQRMRMGPDELRPERGWATIVGVVGDVKQSSLATAEEDAFYVPTTQWAFPDNVMSLAVRARGNAADLTSAVKTAIWSVDKDQPVTRVATMDRLLALSEARRRFALTIFESFAMVGLLLAGIGIYGVLSGSVTERMREIGVRSALGASRSDILALILRQGMSLTGIGVVIGLVGAMLVSGTLATLLYGISRLDPVTYIGVVVLLFVVAAASTWLPAWRAATADPSITLRSE
ncbi:MAG: ADOP family duplicated permease [Actinomycetota bacterium]